jgi:hypothetical protein
MYNVQKNVLVFWTFVSNSAPEKVQGSRDVAFIFYGNKATALFDDKIEIYKALHDLDFEQMGYSHKCEFLNAYSLRRLELKYKYLSAFIETSSMGLNKMSPDLIFQSFKEAI